MNSFPKIIDFRLTAGLIALLVLYAFLVWPALNGPFLFDDFPNLVNLNLVSGNFDWAHIGKYLAAFTGSPGRPISALSFLINDYTWPSSPFGFKYTNLMIHLLNGVLLFGLLRQLAKASPNLPQNIYWPLLAMAAWLAHPLQLSTQMLVVQRMTLLAATFSFAGLWAYIFLLQNAKTLHRAFWSISALGLAAIFAFLSKENGALLPLMAVVLNITLLREQIDSKPKNIRRFILMACAIPAAISLLIILSYGFDAAAYRTRDFTLSDRILTQAHILIDYLKMIFIPRLSGSGIYHDDYPVFRNLLEPISTLIYCILILAAISWALIYRKSYALMSFAILWFFAGHVMESSVLPLELYFEHRNYLPMLGPIIALTALPFLLENLRIIGLFLLSMWVLLLLISTSIQAPVWGNFEQLATIWAKERPMSTRTTQQLAEYYYDHNQQQMAINVLSAGHKRGLSELELKITILFAKCWNPSLQYTGNIYFETLHSIKDSQYTIGTLDALQKLGLAVAKNQCSGIINIEQWWDLSNELLENPKIRINAEDKIRIERAKIYLAQGNLDGTMKELEIAYNLKPSTELSQKIAAILLSAGLVDEAEKWLKKGLDVKQPLFDRLMSDPRDESISILKQLEINRNQ